MLETITKQDLFKKLSGCANIVVCDDFYLINELREVFPSLYVKPLSLVKEGQLSSALYVLMSASNFRNNTSAYLLDETPTEEIVDACTAEFLDNIDLDSTEIDTTEVVETEFRMEEPIEEIESVEVCNRYADKEFDSLSALADALSPDMQIVAKADMIEEVRSRRPDVSVSPIDKGGISFTEGSIVLLRIRSKLYKREVRKVYPPTATLYTVFC